ncbi:extracellular solute-binding protein [Methylovorus menthalis]|uniref:ABC transporter substrate-binding protein n=1 Tax=Methylovorus menthalis TaxID=1002227 RepID=UPI001E54E66A|nr:extracellular solute-binding protein [Methylovorus menthalis]MCB4811206.1 extracellular solute-binding protein [Methylovorus menthalis]
MRLIKQLQILGRWLLAIGIGCISLCACAEERLVVLTSYPQEMVSQFEAAFEQAHPQYRLEVIWRQSADTQKLLSEPGSGDVDVYWSPALRNFLQLRKQAQLRQLPPIDGIAESVHGVQIADPDHYFFASEIAGYGMVVNPQTISASGLPLPTDWQDIASPAWAGKVTLPIPSQVGFAPGLYEAILGALGWNDGWRIIHQMAAQAKLATAGSTFVTDDVASGNFAVGLTIDFFAHAAIANGQPLKFVYPHHVGYSPAHIGILQSSRHVAAAEAFVAFVLSDAGQALLFHPDIRKLPVRASAYSQAPAGYFNPFTQSVSTANQTSLETLLRRQALTSAVFDACITRPQATLDSMWQQLRQAEAQQTGASPSLTEARALAEMPLISEREAEDVHLQTVFRARRENPAYEAETAQYEARWNQEIQQRHARVMALIQQKPAQQTEATGKTGQLTSP